MPDATTYEFACGDIMDGCSATFRGTEDQMFAEITEHARDAHGIDPVPDEVVTAVKERMRPVA